jgi:hypothetical protein
MKPLYLFWGEEFLVRREADALARALVPDAAAGLNFAVLDAASPREIAAELMTLPLFPAPRSSWSATRSSSPRRRAGWTRWARCGRRGRRTA